MNFFRKMIDRFRKKEGIDVTRFVTREMIMNAYGIKEDDEEANTYYRDNCDCYNCVINNPNKGLAAGYNWLIRS